MRKSLAVSMASIILLGCSIPAVLPTPVSTLPASATSLAPTLQPEVPITLTSNTGQRFSKQDCLITTPPSEFDSFYAKYCSAGGIPVLASAEVPDAAVQQAWTIIMNMLAARPDLQKILADGPTRFGVIGVNQVTSTMPEYANIYTDFPGVDWDTRTRGIGATDFIPLSSGAEENLLCYPNDVYHGENITVHEFAHTIMVMGIEKIDASFSARLATAYQNAMQAGLWVNTYAASDPQEYWSEGVQDYFNTNLESDPPDGVHNSINSRAELKNYDPPLYALISEIFPAYDWTPPCP